MLGHDVCKEILMLRDKIAGSTIDKKFSLYSFFNLYVYCKMLSIIDGDVDRDELSREAAELFSKSSVYALKHTWCKPEDDARDPGCDIMRVLYMEGFKDLVGALEENGYRVIVRRYRAVQRVIYGASSGLGRNAFEIGLEVDPIYGVPVIRGSGVKGAVRAYAEGYKNRVSSSSEKEKIGKKIDKLIEVLFGCSDARGSCREVGAVLFLDAYPLENVGGLPIVIPDVITPHRTRDGRETVNEVGVEPVPIVHVSISFGTVFAFPLLVDLYRLRALERRDREGVSVSVDEAIKYLIEWLDCTLYKEGVGLRTSIGYGLFKLVEEGGGKAASRC